MGLHGNSWFVLCLVSCTFCGIVKCQPFVDVYLATSQPFENGTQRVHISPHPGRQINEADINKDLGFKDDEEKFEHVTNGKTRDIKVGIRLWKKRRGRLYIPYEISKKFSWFRRQKLKRAIRKMNSYLHCNKGRNVWIKRNKKKHKHFVKFQPGPGCSGTVGKSKWRINYIKLHNACIDYSDSGIVLHEMMHSMGFYHEMQRGDRDKYIKIHHKNIQKGMTFNFHKFKTYLTTCYDVPFRCIYKERSIDLRTEVTAPRERESRSKKFIITNRYSTVEW
eukprot:TCONS_00022628-protein